MIVKNFTVIRIFFGAICFFLCALVFAFDIPKFGSSVKPERLDSSLHRLVLSSNSMPKEIANNAEIIFVSGYATANSATKGARAKVTIDRPGAKVLVVLSSYERVAWELEATPATSISAVIVSAYETTTVDTKLNVVGYKASIPYVNTIESGNFQSAINQLNSLLGVKKVDAIRAYYEIPSETVIDKRDAPSNKLTLVGEPVVAPSVNFQFDLYTRFYKPIQWSAVGPGSGVNNDLIADGKFVLSPKGDKAYFIDNDKLVFSDIATGQKTTVDLPGNFPNFSWVSDIAYDSRRNIVSIVSFGGEGYLYRYNVKTNKWVDFRSVNNIDIYSMAYDRSADRYVAWASNGSLIFISALGELLFTHDVASKLPGFYRTYDRNNSRPPRLTLAPNGAYVALVNISINSVKNIWVYDIGNQTAKLTYRAP